MQRCIPLAASLRLYIVFTCREHLRIIQVEHVSKNQQTQASCETVREEGAVREKDAPHAQGSQEDQNPNENEARRETNPYQEEEDEDAQEDAQRKWATALPLERTEDPSAGR